MALNSFTVSAGVQWSIDDANTFSKTANAGSFSVGGLTYSESGASGLAMNKMYRIQTTISAGADMDLDLHTSLTDFFGAALNFARIKAILFEHVSSSAATDGVIIGNNGATNPVVAWSMPKIYAGGFFMLCLNDTTGIAVTNGSADVFRMSNEDGSNAATIRLVLGGHSS
jgi:hypothetical protein